MSNKKEKLSQGLKSTKDLKIIEWFNFGCFPGYWVFIQNFSHKEVMKHLKKQKAKGWIATLDDEKLFTGYPRAGRRDVKFESDDKSKAYYFIIMPDGLNTKDSEDLIILAHECVHICQFYLPDLMNRDEENEAEAYLHTHLMRQVIEHLNTSPQ